MFLSAALAVASAFCIALSSMFINELRGRVPLLQLARWQMLAAFLMTGCLSLATGGWRALALWQIGLLAGSSLAGIAVASTTYFGAIYTIGPRITALLFSLTAPFALALGYVFLGETISARQGVGVLLVLAGVALAVGVVPPFLKRGAVAPILPVEPPVAAPATPPMGSMRLGIVLGIVTALGQALGSLLARPAMAAGVEPFTAMAVRSGFAALLFVVLAAFPFARGKRSAVKLSALGLACVSAFFGTALGMSLLMAALHSGAVGIVSTLSSTTPVLILPMVWLRTGKTPSAVAWLGALLAIMGTALISAK